MTNSPALTPRQLEVAALVAKGFTYREIGEQLGIASDTAKSHVKMIAQSLPDDGRPAKFRVLLYYRTHLQGAA